jgi:ribosomal protein L11 methyltransferase
VFSLELACSPRQKDILIAELAEQGSTGILETETGGLRAFFPDDARASALVRRFARFGARYQAEEARDWVEFSKALWEPLLAGSRFFLVPEWRDDPTPPGRLRITIHPSQAFGTGYHESTQLCLEALERHLKPGMTVLDVGTGSGILAAASALLGAGLVFACDIDPVAVQIARRNCGHVFAGSADAVRDQSVDLVAANIDSKTIVAIVPDVMLCLRPGGLALLGGLESGELPEVRIALEAAGAAIRETVHKSGWSLLVATGLLPGQRD